VALARPNRGPEFSSGRVEKVADPPEDIAAVDQTSYFMSWSRGGLLTQSRELELDNSAGPEGYGRKAERG
jgi:hypothetical protein